LNAVVKGWELSYEEKWALMAWKESIPLTIAFELLLPFCISSPSSASETKLKHSVLFKPFTTRRTFIGAFDLMILNATVTALEADSICFMNSLNGMLNRLESPVDGLFNPRYGCKADEIAFTSYLAVVMPSIFNSSKMVWLHQITDSIGGKLDICGYFHEKDAVHGTGCPVLRPVVIFEFSTNKDLKLYQVTLYLFSISILVLFVFVRLQAMH
jgi:hypothetical protein